MEIREERLALPAGLADPKELTVQAVGQIPRSARSIEGVCRSVQHGPDFADKVVPSRIMTVRTRRRQREVLEPERFQIGLDVLGRRGSASERVLRACGQNIGEARDADAPSLRSGC